jgi:hypothetical protein
MCAVHAKTVSGADFTDVERRFLQDHEPGVGLEPVELEGISQGRQSRVTVLGYDDPDGESRLVIWKRMGDGKRLARNEAEHMWERLPHYRQSLIDGGWYVPQLLFSTVVDVSAHESQIFSYEQFIPGGDGDNLLSAPAEPNFRKWHFVTEVLRVLYQYKPEALTSTQLAGRSLTLLPHGLDLKAANFVLERGSDRLYFIDLFGPKELDEDGNWRTYSPKIDPLPQDNLRAVCATREGCVLRFWRLARRLWEPEHERRGLLTDELLLRMESLGMPKAELDFIRAEIEAGFPWLDKLYSERSI